MLLSVVDRDRLSLAGRGIEEKRERGIDLSRPDGVKSTERRYAPQAKGVFEMRDDNCIFCNIIAGEIPSRTLYEDDDFNVILDAGPSSRGHALLLPKEAAAGLVALPDETAAKVLPLAKKVAAHMVEVLGCDGINVLQNNGEAAGQTVHHFHVHLIPRYENEQNKSLLTWGQADISDEEMDEIMQSLR